MYTAMTVTAKATKAAITTMGATTTMGAITIMAAVTTMSTIARNTATIMDVTIGTGTRTDEDNGRRSASACADLIDSSTSAYRLILAPCSAADPGTICYRVSIGLSLVRRCQ